jgi:hypothetical protein
MYIDEATEIQLTADEYNAINKILTATKMDTWCWIDSEERYGEVVDCFIDLEDEDNKMYVEDALSEIVDGLVDELDVGVYGLTEDELDAFNNLVDRYLNN